MGAKVDRETRQDVAEVLVRYATGIDRRDWPLFRTCFTADCDVDYGAIGHWHGVDEITEWMQKTHKPFGHTLHRISNEAVDRDGEAAHARSYVDAILMDLANQKGIRAVGFYEDELVSTAEGWRIARRRFTLVHQSLLDSANG
jgi:3-phenylpropionate/cinnamic acid dioxygenase small subunit